MPDMITITDNFEQGAEILDRVARHAADRTGLMAQIAGVMADEIEENFEKEGRPAKWQKLAPATIRARRRKGNWPGKILQARGRLAASFQARWDNNSAVCGTNVIYARIQHFGGTTKHTARQRVLHFGQSHHGRITPGRDRFARPAKAAYAMKVQGKAYAATIPARPILYIGPGGITRIISKAETWLLLH